MATVHAATAVADMIGVALSGRDRTAPPNWTTGKANFAIVGFNFVFDTDAFFLLFLDGSRRFFG
jgi:hypothetical protein